MQAETWLCLAGLLAIQTGISQSKRVALLPVPFTSHAKYHFNVARALLELGHEVWLIMADYVMEKGVLDTSGCQVIEYSTVTHIESSFMADVRDAYFEKRPPVFDGIFELYKKHCDILLTDEAFVGALRDLDLDLFVIDNILTIRMLTIIPYRLGVPFAFLGTHYDPVAQRIPFSPPVTPWALLPFTHRMTFPQRLQTTLLYLTSFSADPCSYSDAVSRYAPEMPDIPVDMLVARAEIWLVETDHILDYPRPAVPNVKLIGGTAPESPKPLPAEFQSFMDGAAEGVVVVSFGSYVLDLPREIIDKIFSALRKLPFRAVFRSSLTSPEPGTVMTSPWLRQNGQYEALYHAVPVVCLPIFTDQPYNAERMRVKGMAERLDLNTVSKEEPRATILNVGDGKTVQTSHQRRVRALPRRVRCTHEQSRILAGSRDEIWRRAHALCGARPCLLPVYRARYSGGVFPGCFRLVCPDCSGCLPFVSMCILSTQQAQD